MRRRTITLASLTRRAILGSACALGPLGCQGAWDTISSQRFKDNPYDTLFKSEDPLQVLEASSDPDARTRAMRELREPKRAGGSEADQDKAIKLLRTAATADPMAVCRLAAIQGLSTFDDPRANEALLAAYDAADADSKPAAGAGVVAAGLRAGPSPLTAAFAPKTVGEIRSQALDALGRQKRPESVPRLCAIAARPVARSSDRPSDGSGYDPRLADEAEQIEIRHAALRALGNYKGEPQAIRTLVGVLKAERDDVAARGRAYESLKAISGQDLPPDGEAWDAWLAGGKPAARPGGTPGRAGDGPGRASVNDGQ